MLNMIGSKEVLLLMQLVFYFKICSSLALVLQAAVCCRSVTGLTYTMLWVSD